MVAFVSAREMAETRRIPVRESSLWLDSEAAALLPSPKMGMESDFPEASRGYEAVKRGVDIVLAGTFLTLTLPLWGIAAALIKCDSSGPVFFQQERLGRNGQRFRCLKFRTMVPDAEDRLRRSRDLQQAFRDSYKIKDDPRVTRLGQFLRKTSLDEIPQLINVLRGEMTLIGPRPIVPSELEKYGPYGPLLLSVKPGLGGLWQVCGRSNTTYPERVQLDMIYIGSRSFTVDLKLLALTVVSVLKHQGSY